MEDTTTVKVLMIEDSPSDALLIQRNLKTVLEPGFEVTWVKRLDEGVAALKDQPFDVCLLDLSLPDSRGMETCLSMRKAAPKLPIVVLTGAEDEAAVGTEALRVGMQDYLPKSVDGRTISRSVRYAIERNRAGEALGELNSQLARRVEEQTAEIRKANEQLERRIAQRTEELSRANESLRQSRLAALNLAEDALAASRRAEHSREEWVETFNAIPDHIAILDTHYKILRANKAMTDSLGISAGAIAGLPCYTCVHEAPCSIDGCPHAMLLKDGKQHVAEVREERLGGDFLVSVTPLVDGSGNLKGAVHVARDITERKKREEELQRLNRTLRALSRSSQAMVRAEEETAYLKEICSIITEDCGHAMVWIGFAEDDEAKSILPVANAGFEQGYLDTLNLSWADVPRGRGPTGTAIRTGRMSMCTDMVNDPNFAPWHDEALKRGYASSIVFPFMQEGKAFGAITIYARQPDAFSREEIKLLSELSDDLTYGIITLRVRNAAKQAEDALRDERKLIDTVLQTTGGLIVGLDTHGRIMMFNHACEKTTGYGFDEVRGRTLWEFLLVPEEADSVQSVFKGIIAGAIPAETENENYWVAKDGTKRYIRWANSAVKNDAGAVEMVIGTGIDITERRTMEELLRVTASELLTANKELDAFAYSVSHDLRAPLHVITGFSQLLMEHYGDLVDERGKEYIRLLLSEVNRMNRLIGDLLRLSRITRQEIRRVNVDLSLAASETASRLRKEQPGRAVEFIIEPGCAAEADEGLMRIVLENLLGNAWKFTKNKAQARIEFGRSDDDSQLGFFVRDNGAGFDMRGVERLFNPFQRLHDRGEFEGTGIGLAIVKRVITRHGGKVWARSRLGEGAQFHFTLG